METPETWAIGGGAIAAIALVVRLVFWGYEKVHSSYRMALDYGEIEKERLRSSITILSLKLIDAGIALEECEQKNRSMRQVYEDRIQKLEGQIDRLKRELNGGQN